MADEEKLIVAPFHMKAACWKHYKLNQEKTEAVRNYCNSHISYSSGNTSNLNKHLKRKHKDIDIGKTRYGDKDSGSKKKKSMTPSSATPTPVRSPFQGKMSTNSARSKAITSKLLHFIVKDLRPFSIVENEGFRDLIHLLEPSYTIPTRKTLANVELPKLYEDRKIHVKKELQLSTHVALTTDGWTSRAAQGYITVTAHSIDPEWNMKNYTLQTCVLEESHTGANIR